MLSLEFWEATLAGGVLLAVPVLLAAHGELVAERSGVLNIGLEGMMAAGAFTAFYVALRSGSLWLGTFAGIGAGMAVATVMVVVAIRGRADQIVTGFALAVLAPGLVDFFYSRLTGGFSGSGVVFSSIERAKELPIPVLNSIPLIGNAFFAQNAFYYATIGIALMVAFVVKRTRFGLEVAAAGQDPVAAQAKGVRVVRVRTIATLIAGGLGGLGGAALILGSLGTYLPGVSGYGAGTIAGRGFIAIAVVILGRWTPGWTIIAGLAFGIADGLQLRLDDTLGLPVQILATLPWLVVLVMLILGARSRATPRALGRRIQDSALSAVAAREEPDACRTGFR
jgi:ABC-type uncharacterized transport system permease subunit